MPSPLIKRLIDELGYSVLTKNNSDKLLNLNRNLCLFFTENPNRFPESDDVAVVLPELITAFEGKFSAVVVDNSIEKNLQHKYGFRVWPALVFLRDGEYLGCIEKIRDWSDYMTLIPTILSDKSKRAPGIGIAITSEITTLTES